MADLITSDEYVTIGGVPLATPAWRVENISELWQTADVDGSDTPIPGAHGARPNPRWRRPTRRQLQLFIFGDAKRDGTPIANSRKGVWDNVADLRTSIVTAPNTTDGTRAMVVHLSGTTTTLVGDVHVESLAWSPFSPGILAATIDISIPAGELVITP